MAKLGDYIREECHPLGARGAQDLHLIGVSNEHGLHPSSRDTSDDLSRYQRIERDWFAYNPMRVNVGSIGLADDETKTGFTSPDYTVFSCRPGLDPHFLLHFLKSDYGLEEIARHCSGAVRKRLYYGGLAEIELPIPRLDEQRALVARIYGISETIRFIRQENSDRHELPHLKQAILQEAIQGKLTADWRFAHPDVEPANQLLERIKAERARLLAAGKARPEKSGPKTALPDNPFAIPNGWEWTFVRDLLAQPPKNGLSIKGSSEPPGVAVLRLNALTNGGLDYDQRRYIQVTKADIEEILIKQGDFFVARGNGSLHLLGRGGVAGAISEDVIFPDTMIRLRFIFGIAEWANIAWRTQIVRKGIEAKAKTAAGIYKISQDSLLGIAIPLPPLAEQAAIVKRVELLMTTCRALDAEIEHSRAHAAHLLQAILKEAFAPVDTISG